MGRARLTTFELIPMPRGSHARRRLLAACFGLFALLVQTGFSFGAALAHDGASGRLAADLTQLCLGSAGIYGDGIPGKAAGGSNSETPGHSGQSTTLGCDHCRLCGVALAIETPVRTAEPPLRTVFSAEGASYSAHAPSAVAPGHQPRAPPL